jgi:hypothetical protein
MDKDNLIESFVKEWGYYDGVLNEDFHRAIEELISQVCPEAPEPPPIREPDDRPRKIVLREEE